MTLTKTAVATVLGLILVAGPAAAQTPEDLKKAVDKLEQATKDLQAAKDALKIDALHKKSATIESKLDLMDADLQEIKKELRDLKRRIGDGTSTSNSPRVASSTDQSRVRFINEFTESMSVVLNGQAYRLVPGEERLITIPPGDFTYQVLQLQRSTQERRITAGETKTVRIFPLQ